ncbi:MAG: hypothetical protein HPY61_14760 [Methanotrichaceae archaeon]|nr:hypothetical protein [Methanotrichaceae archaeon]
MKEILLILALGLIISITHAALEISESPYGKVDPENGSIYITKPATGLEDLPVYTYVYSVDLEKLKEISMAEDPLFLEIYNPETGNWINTSINTAVDGDPDITRPEIVHYKVNLAELGSPFLGLSRFRFVDARGNALRDANNGDAIEFSGPRIVVNLKDENYKRLAEGKYSYGVWARSEDTIAIGLRGTTDLSNWVWVGSPLKSSSMGWTKLEWIKMPYYKVIEFKIYSKS